MTKPFIFRHIDKPQDVKYRRIFFLGTRSKYPWQGSFIHQNSDVTIEQEINSVGSFPILFKWIDSAGEARYSEATIDNSAKAAN